VGALPHANVTAVPFQMDSGIELEPVAGPGVDGARGAGSAAPSSKG